MYRVCHTGRSGVWHSFAQDALCGVLGGGVCGGNTKGSQSLQAGRDLRARRIHRGLRCCRSNPRCSTVHGPAWVRALCAYVCVTKHSTHSLTHSTLAAQQHRVVVSSCRLFARQKKQQRTTTPLHRDVVFRSVRDPWCTPSTWLALHSFLSLLSVNKPSARESQSGGGQGATTQTAQIGR